MANADKVDLFVTRKVIQWRRADDGGDAWVGDLECGHLVDVNMPKGYYHVLMPAHTCDECADVARAALEARRG